MWPEALLHFIILHACGVRQGKIFFIALVPSKYFFMINKLSKKDTFMYVVQRKEISVCYKRFYCTVCPTYSRTGVLCPEMLAMNRRN